MRCRNPQPPVKQLFTPTSWPQGGRGSGEILAADRTAAPGEGLSPRTGQGLPRSGGQARPPPAPLGQRPLSSRRHFPPLLRAASPALAAPSRGRQRRRSRTAAGLPARGPGPLPIGPDRQRRAPPPRPRRRMQDTVRPKRRSALPAGGRQRLKSPRAARSGERPARGHPRSSPGDPRGWRGSHGRGIAAMEITVSQIPHPCLWVPSEFYFPVSPSWGRCVPAGEG